VGMSVFSSVLDAGRISSIYMLAASEVGMNEFWQWLKHIFLCYAGEHEWSYVYLYLRDGWRVQARVCGHCGLRMYYHKFPVGAGGYWIKYPGD